MSGHEMLGLPCFFDSFSLNNLPIVSDLCGKYPHLVRSIGNESANGSNLRATVSLLLAELFKKRINLVAAKVRVFGPEAAYLGHYHVRP